MGMGSGGRPAGVSSEDVVHPRAVSPIDPLTGAERPLLPLGDGEAYTWQPLSSPSGPVSMVMSTADQQLLVFRNGVEIGRARIALRGIETPIGTQAFIVGQGFPAGRSARPARPAHAELDAHRNSW